jgi:peptide/nickel transport system substrate-binding protein
MAIDRTEVRKITSMDVLDDYTLQINLSEYDNGLEHTFTSYVGLMTSPTYFEEHGEEWCNTYPVGTGPFKFVSFQRDVNLKYERFDGYWQEGKPYLDGVEFIYIADPMVRLASFQAGEADVLLGLEPLDAKSLEAAGDVVFSTCLGGLCGLAGDGAHPDSPFADIKVRQAIEFAIDREPVVKAVGLGFWGATDQSCGKET